MGARARAEDPYLIAKAKREGVAGFGFKDKGDWCVDCYGMHGSIPDYTIYWDETQDTIIECKRCGVKMHRVKRKGE